MVTILLKIGNWERWQIILMLFALLAVALVVVWPKPPKRPDSVKNVAELEGWIKKLTDSGTPRGMSFAVINNNQIVYAKGFGWADHPKKIAATPDAVYHWFSITKIVTAIAILQLREKGKLQIDDQVDRYLPFFRVQYTSDSDKVITIRNLLNHSSGLPDAKLDLAKWIHYDGEPSFNQTAFVEKIFPMYSKLAFGPGDYSKYTNIGYMVLGAIIEKVTGQSYEDYVRQNILIPLDMSHTDFVYSKAMEAYEAAGSNPLFNLNTLMIPFVRGKIIRETYKNHIWLDRFYNNQTPPSGLIGPVTDASRLVMAYLNNGELDGKQILYRESVYSMTHESYSKLKNEDPSDTFRQGIGWQTRTNQGRLVIKHDGGGLGFFTIIQLFPDENLGFVIFTNDFASRKEVEKIINLAANLKW
jgi:D-alanyl-D-alanine carboxypeptidase